MDSQKRSEIFYRVSAIISRCNGANFHFYGGNKTPVEVIQSYEQGLDDIKKVFDLENAGEEMITVNKKEYEEILETNKTARNIIEKEIKEKTS